MDTTIFVSFEFDDDCCA